MEIFLIVLGAICIIAALLGCFLPVIPGPPLGYIGILILHYSGVVQFSNMVLIGLLIATIVVQLSDYFLPIWFTKKFGGGKAGIIGCTLGLILGFIFSPIGIIVGPIIGAIIGEMISGKEFSIAVKSGLGSFVGFITTTGAKLAVCCIFLYYFITEVINNYF